MNLINLLRQNCDRLGSKPVFIEGDSALSYGDFYHRVLTMAAGLARKGIGLGDNVLVLMPLSVELYAALCAVWTVGACAVIFDPSAGRAHIAACLGALNVKAFVGNTNALLLRFINRPIGRIPLHLNVKRLSASGGNPDCPIAEVAADTPALITFTSGSTGLPKAIVRSHGFLLGQHRALVDVLPYREDDIDLAVLAVFTLVNMMEGITTVLPDDSLRDIAAVDAGRLAGQIARHGVTRITCSPKLMEKLSDHAIGQGVRLHSLRSVNIGGGPVFPDLLEKVVKIADPAGIRVVYGSTEAEPIAELRYTDITEQDIARMQAGGGLLVGTPAGTVELRIIENRPGVPITAGELDSLDVTQSGWGEIIVAGDHVVKGYLNPAQNAAAKIMAGDKVWHRTGDCGRLDDAGRLWLLGRASQVIGEGGTAIFPFAVESAIRARYGAISALVEVDGYRVLAIGQGPQSEGIRAEYGDRFRVVVLDHIPLDRRHASKIDYGTLTAIIRREISIPPKG